MKIAYAWSCKLTNMLNKCSEAPWQRRCDPHHPGFWTLTKIAPMLVESRSPERTRAGFGQVEPHLVEHRHVVGRTCTASTGFGEFSPADARKLVRSRSERCASKGQGGKNMLATKRHAHAPTPSKPPWLPIFGALHEGVHADIAAKTTRQHLSCSRLVHPWRESGYGLRRPNCEHITPHAAKQSRVSESDGATRFCARSAAVDGLVTLRDYDPGVTRDLQADMGQGCLMCASGVEVTAEHRTARPGGRVHSTGGNHNGPKRPAPRTMRKRIRGCTPPRHMNPDWGRASGSWRSTS